ncbi:MAG TPA: tRNA pseudouridine(55) synthase TruB [Tepidisphaeraceae bacterium]
MTNDQVINLDKPAGISSARAVAIVKRAFPRGTKVGHAGTLDPFATGVLLILVGKATKRCEELMGTAKVYEATIKLGATTETLDPESEEIEKPIQKIPALADIEIVAEKMTGLVWQRPPVFSAMKVGGQRAYKLARKGEAVELALRQVRIDRFEIVDYQWPMLRIRVECGRGTYIRAIARDLGEALGTGGYLTQLRRTRVGEFDISNAVSIQSVSTS